MMKKFAAAVILFTRLPLWRLVSPSQEANIWLVIGVVVLIALLLIWLTVADFFGDTDVAALVSPLV